MIEKNRFTGGFLSFFNRALSSIGTIITITGFILLDEFDDDFELILPIGVILTGILMLAVGLYRMYITSDKITTDIPYCSNKEYKGLDWHKYMADIERAKKSLKDEDIINLVTKLEENTKAMTDYILKNPAQLYAVKRIMDECLPAVCKTLNVYITLDNVNIEQSDFSKTKNDIKEFIIQLNRVFEEKLISLYENIAIDVSSEISAMTTILQNKGLINNHSFIKD